VLHEERADAREASHARERVDARAYDGHVILEIEILLHNLSAWMEVLHYLCHQSLAATPI
jgi:hypothetical protein